MKAIFSNDRFGINRKDFLFKINTLFITIRPFMDGIKEWVRKLVPKM